MSLYLLVFIGSGAIGGPVIGRLDELAGPRDGLATEGLLPLVATVALSAWMVTTRATAPPGVDGVGVAGPGGSERLPPRDVERVAIEIDDPGPPHRVESAIWPHTFRRSRRTPGRRAQRPCRPSPAPPQPAGTASPR